MSKRPTTKPGAFTRGIQPLHYKGLSAEGRKLAEKAETARKRRVQWLRRTFEGNDAGLALADKIDACRPKRRCHSGACPVCTQAGQELFVDMISTLVKSLPKKKGKS